MTALQDWNPGFPTWKRLNLAHRTQGMDKFGLDLLEVCVACVCVCVCLCVFVACRRAKVGLAVAATNRADRPCGICGRRCLSVVRTFLFVGTII